jgi:hypothetical protein
MALALGTRRSTLAAVASAGPIHITAANRATFHAVRFMPVP